MKKKNPVFLSPNLLSYLVLFQAFIRNRKFCFFIFQASLVQQQVKGALGSCLQLLVSLASALPQLSGRVQNFSCGKQAFSSTALFDDSGQSIWTLFTPKCLRKTTPWQFASVLFFKKVPHLSLCTISLTIWVCLCVSAPMCVFERDREKERVFVCRSEFSFPYKSHYAGLSAGLQRGESRPVTDSYQFSFSKALVWRLSLLVLLVSIPHPHKCIICNQHLSNLHAHL